MAKNSATVQSSKTPAKKALSKEEAAKLKGIVKNIAKMNRAPLKTAEKINDSIKKAESNGKKSPKNDVAQGEHLEMNGKITAAQRKRINEIHEEARALSTEAMGIIRDARDVEALELHRKFEATLWNRFAYTKRQISE